MSFSAQLPKLINNYGSDNVRTAIIQHWVKKSGLSLSDFRTKSVTQKYLDGSNSKEVTLLVNNFGTLLPKPTLKEIEKLFELTLDRNHRRNLGTVYTPEYIIDYLTKYALEFAYQNRVKLPKFCDPSCGSGGFLIRIAEILEELFSIPGEKAFSEYIVGIDIDRKALEQAKCLIELYLAYKRQNIPDLDNSLHKLDTLTCDRTKLLSLTNSQEGFDVIVTNPPYVKFQNLSNDYRQILIDEYYGYAKGNFSLSLLFLIKGYELLSANGCLGMITQNNLFTSLAGRNIREYLQKQECIKRIVDFTHHKVFNNASAYTCLIFLSKQKTLEFDYGSISDNREIDNQVLQELNFSKIQISKLKPVKWRLGKDSHLENLKKIESIGRSLSEVADIKVGFATLKDSVFFVRQKDSVCLAIAPSGNIYHIEYEITQPAVKVSEIKSEIDLVKNNRRIIFPYFKYKNVFKLISEQEFQKDFPNTFAYLLESRSILESRDKGRKQYENWFAWARTQGMESPGPKLLTKTFSKLPQFILDNSDQLFCNGYGVSPKPPNLFEPSIPIKFLEKVLNSSIMHYYAKMTSFQIEGDYQCYQKNFIEKFGIPNLPHSRMNEIIDKNHDEVDIDLAIIYGVDLNDIFEIVARK